MTYVDDIESDALRFYRLDIWSVSFHRVMRLASRLPAYGGALARAMAAAEHPAGVTAQEVPAGLPTAYPQPVESSVQRGQHAKPDTTPEEWERLWAEVRRKEYPDATGFREVSGDEMERLINNGR